MRKSGVSGQERRGETNEKKGRNEGLLDGVMPAGNMVIVVWSLWVECFLVFCT